MPYPYSGIPGIRPPLPVETPGRHHETSEAIDVSVYTRERKREREKEREREREERARAEKI